MPKGPQGQWRPVSDTACAAHVMKIATGEIEEPRAPRPALLITSEVDSEAREDSEEPILRLGSGLPLPPRRSRAQ